MVGRVLVSLVLSQAHTRCLRSYAKPQYENVQRIHTILPACGPCRARTRHHITFILPPSNARMLFHCLECQRHRKWHPILRDREEHSPFPKESLWDTAASITKIFRSTILADLGQNNPNILVDNGLLRFFSKNITTIAAEQAGGDDKWGARNNLKVSAQLAQGPFTSENATKWDMKADPSFMSVTYLFQVPQLKSTSSLIISVLVADFVFLQVLWKVFVLVVDFFMYRKYSGMGACQGCQGGQMRRKNSFEMVRPKSSVSSLTPKPSIGATYSPH